MEIHAAYIPDNMDEHFLLKLFNVHVPVGVRPYRAHHHIHFELTLFKDGEGTYEHTGERFPIRPGDVFVHASNEVHWISEITRPLSLMNVHFEPRFLWSGSGAPAPANELICFSHSPAFVSRLPPEDAATARIRQLLLEMEQEFGRRAPEYELMIRLKVSEVMVLLVRELHYADGLTENPTLSRHLDAVGRAMDYIGAHLTEPLTLRDIAAQAQMSPSYFSAVFRRIHSVGLWDYITEKRVELAMRLLDTEDRSMLEVAMRSGFNNTANFNKTFLRCTGRTPSEYRRHGNAVFY